MNKSLSVFGLLIFLFSSGHVECVKPKSFLGRCLNDIWERLPHRPFRPLMMHWMMNKYLEPESLGSSVVGVELASQCEFYSQQPGNFSAIPVRFPSGLVRWQSQKTLVAHTTPLCWQGYEGGGSNDFFYWRIKLSQILRDEIAAGRDTPLKAELYNDFKLILFSLIAIICAHASVEGIAEFFNPKYKKLSNLKKLPKSLLQRWFLMKEKLDSNDVQSSEVKVIRHGMSMIKRKLFIALILLCIFCRVDDCLGLVCSSQTGYDWCPLNYRYWYCRL